MKPHYQSGPVTLYHGDCRAVMATLPDESVHAVVTDPPYELTGKSGGGGFMGKSWDSTGVAFDVAVWREALRVLKPGGHLLAFGGSRTYHRMAVAIEDAGFELRDSIAWLYGSGMPKSLDVSKAIDKAGGDSPMVRGAELRARREAAGLSREKLAEMIGCSAASVGNWEDGRSRSKGLPVEFITPGPQYRQALFDAIGYPLDARSVVGDADDRRGDGTVIGLGHSGVEYGAAATVVAQQWQGWGTALKPSHEPVVCARKPLVGTVAANVLAFGTGALNIDATRVGDSKDVPASPSGDFGRNGIYGKAAGQDPSSSGLNPDIGRWPTNVALDESQAAVLDAQSGRSVSRIGKPRGADAGEGWGMTKTGTEYADEGGASRFFPTFKYEAKAPTSERPVVDGVAHATVKPLKLMQWLVRLVTPPGGVVLDPFAGSGTTLEAAVLEGFDSIGIELEEAHLPLIKSRFKKPFDQYLDLGDVG